MSPLWFSMKVGQSDLPLPDSQKGPEIEESAIHLPSQSKYFLLLVIHTALDTTERADHSDNSKRKLIFSLLQLFIHPWSLPVEWNEPL